MSNLIKLVLLYGGKSGEHEISLRSAASVLAALDPKRYDIQPIGIDKSGRFFLSDYKKLLQYPDALPVLQEESLPLSSLVNDGRLAVEADVIFPVVHGPMYEDGCLQGILEHSGTAYVGCDVLSSAIGMDKDIQRRILGRDLVPFARYQSLSRAASAAKTLAICQQTIQDFGLPLFVKPCSLGSSVGIHKAHNLEQLLAAVEDAKKYDQTVLIEEFIQGREIELAVLENKDLDQAPRVSIAGEIAVHHADNFYSYSAKYIDSQSTTLDIPAKLEPGILKTLQAYAAEIFTRLKCRGMARVDFFVGPGPDFNIYFNEINTIPGFTSISMYPKLWEASGLAYPKLLDELIDLSLSRHRFKQDMLTHYQP